MLYWQDAMLLDPKALIERLAAKIQAPSQIFFNHEVLEIERFNNNILLSSSSETIEAKYLINCCASPRIELKGISSHVRATTQRLGLTRGFNLVLAKDLCPDSVALGFESPGKKRLFFLAPRDKGCALGTGYLGYEGGDINITEEETLEYLNEVNRALNKDNQLDLNDVTEVESGLIPTPSKSSIVPIEQDIFLQDENYLEVIAAKYTTFAQRAEKALGSNLPPGTAELQLR